MITYGELREVFKGAIEWVENNLNPHQQLIITLDGIKIVSDDYFEPMNAKRKDGTCEFEIQPHSQLLFDPTRGIYNAEHIENEIEGKEEFIEESIKNIHRHMVWESIWDSETKINEI